MPKVTGVYTLTDSRTGKFYVGSTSDIAKRAHRHFKELRENRHHCIPFQKLWNSGKVNLVLSEFPTETREEAYLLEQDIIDRHQDSQLLLNVGLGVRGGDNLSRNPNREDILARIKESLIERLEHMTPIERRLMYGKFAERNGMWGRTHTPEARAKMSSANLGITRRSGFTLTEEHRKMISDYAKTRTGEKNPFFDKHHSDETKRRLSEQGKLRASEGFIPANARKVKVDDTVYVSLTEASRQLGIAPALMVYRLQSDKEKYSNYQYVTEMPNDYCESK
jgi:group I intron endonuclease